MTQRTCSLEDCDRPATTCGLCRTCYQREWHRQRSGYYERYSDGSCEVEGCEEPRRSRGTPLCETHYYRKRRTGDVQAHIPVRKKRFGPRVCEDEECDVVIDKGRWCSKHAARVWRHGDPTVVKKATPSPTYGPDNPTWLGESLTSYSGQHSRLRHHRGLAADQVCVDCGAPAEQWSYDHGCPDERVNEHGSPWCPHLDCYSPRDRSCHLAYDRTA